MARAGILVQAGILERGFCGEYAVRESWKCVILKKIGEKGDWHMLLSKEEYEHALQCLDKKGQGGSPEEGLLREMQEWAGNREGLELYDYFCDRLESGRLRLKIVLWDMEAEKMVMKGANYNGKKQREFADKFADLSRKYGIYKEYWKAWDVFVTFDTLKDEIQSRITERAAKEIHALACGDIWRIEVFYGTIHCFYETDAQIAAHGKDGVSRAFWENCSKIVRRYDKYGVFQEGISCTFTSRQTLDEKYNGSLFFYFR